MMSKHGQRMRPSISVNYFHSLLTCLNYFGVVRYQIITLLRSAWWSSAIIRHVGMVTIFDTLHSQITHVHTALTAYYYRHGGFNDLTLMSHSD